MAGNPASGPDRKVGCQVSPRQARAPKAKSRRGGAGASRAAGRRPRKAPFAGPRGEGYDLRRAIGPSPHFRSLSNKLKL